jgi:flagellar basal-body rod modification protein FlgD
MHMTDFPLGAVAGQTTAAARTSPGAGGVTSDYTTFLKMLTVQMQNQDPLNPVESTDYAVQLATFSGVEQQVRTNDLLQGLARSFGVMGMAQLAGWVGQEARADAPVWMDGDPVTVSPNPAQGADRAVLIVTDAAGTVMAREDLPVAADPYRWAGLDATGAPLPAGRYTLMLESYRDGDVVATTPVESYMRIREAQGGPDGITLVLEGGVRVRADAITALRSPP